MFKISELSWPSSPVPVIMSQLTYHCPPYPAQADLSRPMLQLLQAWRRVVPLRWSINNNRQAKILLSNTGVSILLNYVHISIRNRKHNLDKICENSWMEQITNELLGTKTNDSCHMTKIDYRRNPSKTHELLLKNLRSVLYTVLCSVKKCLVAVVHKCIRFMRNRFRIQP